MANQANLIEQLTTIHRATETASANLDAAHVIFADSGWRLHDLIGHVAIWYGVRVQALRAWRQGEVFRLPDDYSVDDYNQTTTDERKDWTYAAIRADWQQSFDDLIAAIDALDPADLNAEMTLPWGASGTVAYFVERMIIHAQSHLEDIQRAQ